MARIERVELSCDRCGAGENVTAERFAAGGTRYVIDLCAACRTAFRETLSVFAARARRAGAARSPGAGPKPRTKASRERAAAIRAWARAEGILVDSRGRIAASVVRRYEARESRAA